MTYISFVSWSKQYQRKLELLSLHCAETYAKSVSPMPWASYFLIASEFSKISGKPPSNPLMLDDFLFHKNYFTLFGNTVLIECFHLHVIRLVRI